MWFYNRGDIPDSQALQRRFEDVGLNSLQYVKDYMRQVVTCILLHDKPAACSTGNEFFVDGISFVLVFCYF